MGFDVCLQHRGTLRFNKEKSALAKAQLTNRQQWRDIRSPVTHQEPSRPTPGRNIGMHQKGCDLRNVVGTTPPIHNDIPRLKQ